MNRHGALQKVAELAPFLALVEKLKPQTIVEIGICKGGTLAALSEVAAEGALLVSVDLPGGDFGGGYTEADVPRLRELTHRCRLVPILGDSHSPETLERARTALAGREVDVLFIDGDHSYEGVRADFEMYAPLVRAGGLIAFLDIAEHPAVPECQVHLFWRELAGESRTLELFDPTDVRGGQWGGIGVVTV